MNFLDLFEIHAKIALIVSDRAGPGTGRTIILKLTKVGQISMSAFLLQSPRGNTTVCPHLQTRNEMSYACKH